jgi:ribosome-associated toxin RatA of RatAB toxin-antitoxin module
MVTVRDSREIPASLLKIWEIVSDVDNDPKYWPGINSINNISKDGNIIEREATVGFRNSKSKQTVILEPTKTITTKMNEGPMIGTKVITLDQLGDIRTKIDVVWDFRLDGIPVLFRNGAQRNIIEGTREALDRIARVFQ